MCQLSRLLNESGVRRGDRVGVYLNRSLETAAAIYGIMNAGAAYVPLDPGAPPQRTRFLIEDCGIRHVVTNPSQRRGLQAVISEKTSLRSIIGLKENWPVTTVSWEEVAQFPATIFLVKTLDQDLAYVMYTSGSTGLPKGIMHTHYSGLAYAKLTAATYGLHASDVIGNHAPLHFDISTLGYFTAPFVGATTVIVPDAHTKMPASLSQLMEKERLTVWYSVPLALVQLLQRGVLEQRDLTSLRWVLYGGEPFPVKHLRALMLQWPQARFSNVYGPAEVNQCTFYHFEKPPEEDEPIPLGQVWDNTEMLILNENDEAAGVGETGELLIRSATMMQGYWNNPDLTEKAFFKKETTSGLPATYYRTGDLVQLAAKPVSTSSANRLEPLLYFHGRKDRQIKTRGYRVELDEVAAVLLLHEAVAEAAVFPVENEDEGWLIEAAVILKNGLEADGEGLRQFTLEKLPLYAAPQKIHMATDFPRTSSGKVDYNRIVQFLGIKSSFSE
jgi:amino acid adenylation domain-containing protein